MRVIYFLQVCHWKLKVCIDKVSVRFSRYWLCAYRCKGSVDGVSSEITCALGVGRVADTNITVDVQDCALPAWRGNSGDEVELVAVSVVLPRDGSVKV